VKTFDHLPSSPCASDRYVQQAITKPRTTAMLGLLIPVLISVIAFAAYPLELDSSGGNWCVSQLLAAPTSATHAKSLAACLPFQLGNTLAEI
jgi:hypothetical protein